MTDKPPAPPGSVGYRAPPVAQRFRPGQSGNPAGRPKGARNMLTMMNAELSQLVTATENGKPRRMPMGQAIVKRLISLAASGNLRATELLLKHADGKSSEPSADTANGPIQQNEQDKAILERHMARMRAEAAGREDDDNE